MALTAQDPAATMTTALPDAWRIEVFRKEGVDDPAGAQLVAAAHELGLRGLRRARAGRGFLLSPTLDPQCVERIARELLVDPVLDEARILSPRTEPDPVSSRRVLVARKPGVMDPVALTVQKAMRRAELVDATDELFVSTFTAWELDGELSASELELLASTVLGNDTIEDVEFAGEGLHYGPPKAGAVHRRG